MPAAEDGRRLMMAREQHKASDNVTASNPTSHDGNDHNNNYYDSMNKHCTRPYDGG